MLNERVKIIRPDHDKHRVTPWVLNLEYEDGGITEYKDKWFRSFQEIRGFLHAEYPHFIESCGVFYSAKLVETVTIESNGYRTTQPLVGTLFRVVSKSPKETIYVSLDDDIDALSDISDSIDSGEETTAFRYALIRRRTPMGWSYYPLPLVYASEADRINAAISVGQSPRPERWIRRRRATISALLSEVLDVA